MCYATIPVAALRTGYRSVQLRDRNGCRVAFSALLCHFRKGHTHLPPAVYEAATRVDAKEQTPQRQPRQPPTPPSKGAPNGHGRAARPTLAELLA